MSRPIDSPGLTILIRFSVCLSSLKLSVDTLSYLRPFEGGEAVILRTSQLTFIPCLAKLVVFCISSGSDMEVRSDTDYRLFLMLLKWQGYVSVTGHLLLLSDSCLFTLNY